MDTPPIVSAEEWDAAREQLLVKEKELTHARDALAAERRRMPWLAVEKEYKFDGPDGAASLLELFDGRRQLIVYRAFFEPGVHGWPEHACPGCSMVADQVAHLAHLNARDTTLVFASRAPQPEIRTFRHRPQGEANRIGSHCVPEREVRVPCSYVLAIRSACAFSKDCHFRPAFRQEYPRGHFSTVATIGRRSHGVSEDPVSADFGR
jgi:hypothetical protein